jgi:hypothetical protein
MPHQRTRSRLLFAIVVVYAFTTVNSALGQAKSSAVVSDDKAKQELLDLENHWLHSEHDPDALESILAPDFLHVLEIGIITKEQHIDYWRKHPATPSPPEHFEDMHVRVYGTVGIVNGVVVRNQAEGLRRTLFTDVFAYRDGKWQAVSAQELPVPEKTP